ncbi:MAG: RimK family alpha-L-glutamate ligase [Nitriliruptorales bacterium]
MSRIDVALLLGRPPSEKSVLWDTVRRMSSRGLRVAGFLVHEPPTALPQAERYVLRSLSPAVLRVLCGRLEAARCINAPAATAVVRDKARTARLLEAAGLPVPHTDGVERWEQIVERWTAAPIVVKSRFGSRGEGVFICEGRTLPARPPFPGPYLVQERIVSDGVDRKLYVIGGRVAGVLRSFPAPTPEQKRGAPFDPHRGLVELARGVGRVLGLSAYGVDVLLAPTGPVIVDVNAMPGFKGVEGAAASLADVLSGGGREEVPCGS